MVSAFLVNDRAIDFRNPSEVTIEINGVTSDAERTDSGDLTALTKVNSIPKLSLKWDYLSVQDMEKLCTLFNIDVAEYNSAYTVKTITDLVYKITTRLPMGIKSFSAYVSDTLKGTLVDTSGNEDVSQIGGQYWTDITLSLVGTGEQWNV